MKYKTLLFAALAFPVTALAFDYVAHSPYTDVRSNSKEAAAVYMLTNEGAVKGYAPGKFGPSRKVNRAEFLKIALASVPWDTEALPSGGCMPDVPPDSWFGGFVCYAVRGNIVKGYPDGLFHPERTVQYDEALKILSLIYEYDVGTQHGDSWGEPYYLAAKERGTDLPVTIAFDSPLTRAEVVRLVAAFLAEHEGRLVEYRMAESGTYPESSSSSSSVPASSSSSSSSTVSSSVSSSASSINSVYTLPSVSHFLLTGKMSDAIGDGAVRHDGEAARIRAIEVKLFQEVPALDTLKVFTADGTEVVTLTRRTNVDTLDYKQIYYAQMEPGKDFPMADGKSVHLVVRADVRSLLNNGASNQPLQMRTFNVTVQGVASNQTFNYVVAGPFPAHQTTYGRFSSVTPAGPATGTLQAGTGFVVATYTFSGSSVEGRSLFVEHLIFTPEKSDNVETTMWTLGNEGGSVNVDCSVGSDGISCFNLQPVMGLLKEKGVTLKLRANVKITGASPAFLQAYLAKHGSPNDLGSVHWTDESGDFRWIEAGTIRGKGTRWQK